MKTEEKIKTPNCDWHLKEGQRSLNDYVSSQEAEGTRCRPVSIPALALYTQSSPCHRVSLCPDSLQDVCRHHPLLFLSKLLNEIRFTEREHSCF